MNVVEITAYSRYLPLSGDSQSAARIPIFQVSKGLVTSFTKNFPQNVSHYSDHKVAKLEFFNCAHNREKKFKLCIPCKQNR